MHEPHSCSGLIPPLLPIGLVIGLRRGQQALAQGELALVVLLDHHQLPTTHRHAAARGVLQPHQQPGLGLLAIGLQRTRLAGPVLNACSEPLLICQPRPAP